MKNQFPTSPASRLPSLKLHPSRQAATPASSFLESSRFSLPLVSRPDLFGSQLNKIRLELLKAPLTRHRE